MSDALPRAPIRILLIEDDEADATLFKETLLEGGAHYRVEVAADGEQALDYLFRRDAQARAQRPDLILLDLNLPKIGGFEILGAVRKDPELKLIPVIVLTTSEAPRDILKSYGLCANAFVTKPVSFAEFARVVRALNEFWLTIAKLPGQV